MTNGEAAILVAGAVVVGSLAFAVGYSLPMLYDAIRRR